MATANATNTNLQTLECAAGHTWTREPTGRKAPKYCPEHKRFLNGPISAGCQPKQRVRAEWEDAEKNLVNERGYANRWLKFWRDNVRVLAARVGSWGQVDTYKYEEFIRHTRLAELHRLFAQDNPYFTTEGGAIRSHPGWKNAKAAQREADRLAVELGLKVDSSKHASSNGGAAQGQPSKLEQEAAEVGIADDQIGPDGQPL